MWRRSSLRGIESHNLPAYTDWVAAHADAPTEIDGSVVGVAWLLIAERLPGNGSLDRRYGDIQAVEVREEYRNRGSAAR